MPRHLPRWARVVGVLVLLGPAPPAPGEPIRLPATRDAWFSDVGAEAEGSNGGAPQLKVKSHQEMSLIDVDVSPLRGRVVERAALRVRLSGPERLRRLTVGSFGADWVEGQARGYAPEPGASSFNHRRNPDVPWTLFGGDLCHVMLGEGGTLWRMADASAPDPEGWQEVPVAPEVVAARVAGISEGFLLFDDTGTEWSRDGERFTRRHMPNRFFRSRESGHGSAPSLTVRLGPEDRSSPAAPAEVRSETGELPSGEAWVTWASPADRGAAGTIGFFARVDGREVPRYLIPLASRPGERVRMHLRDLGLKAGAEVALDVRAVDGAGNRGPAAEARVRVSGRAVLPLPGTDPVVSPGEGPLPRVGDATVAIVDELDKVHPVTGALIPGQPAAYLEANHLWDARSGTIRLHGARNEFVAFQVVIGGDARGLRPALELERAGGAPIAAEFGRYRDVETPKGPLPDPIVPLDAPDDPTVSGRRSTSLHAELYVPHDAKAGEHRGTLRLSLADGRSLALKVVLHVWDFTLPDTLSFLPEMNAYGLPADERAYFRLAHRHRTVLNRLPYHQNGAIEEGCAPGWDGTTLAWDAWDRRFGPYLDGSAFADLPRRGVPLEVFYLPLHENWPTPIEGAYNGDYWADRAFPARYRRAFVAASRQFATHCNDRGWDRTLFEFFLNGKNDFKDKGWSRGSSPWLLDEPASFQDFWALRYFGAAFHEGIAQARGRAKLVFRCDISRPEWQRDALDGLLDVNVVGGAMRRYRRLVLDRKEAQGQVVIEYGGSNAIEDANVQPAAWCVDAWSLGTDGVLPWQTIGNDASWAKADPLSLFYPARPGYGPGPVPSVRLKAYRRGQQDVEYLTLLALVKGEPRWALATRVREALGLAGQRKGSGLTGGEDAGLIQFGRLTPRALWALRTRVGEVLSDAHPAPRRSLVEFRTPPRDPSTLQPRLVPPDPAPAGSDPRRPAA